MRIEAEDIGAVRPSAYNPRQADPRRLDLIELSLRKLGFLAPIYADGDGEILSGHQRHLVASRMGATRIPVFRVGAMSLERRKALNIVFNRATNDFDISSTPGAATRELEGVDIRGLAAAIPDKDVGGPGFMRCLSPGRASVKELCRVNAGRWIRYARNLARTLDRNGVEMPLVCRADGTVVNGIGRLEMLAERGAETAPVVYVTDEEAEFARAMMNLLSMDFDIHTRYADLLRHNSFRRARRVREGLGNGFTFAVHGSAPCGTFDIRRAADRARWVKEHGNCVLDFGAGHLTETMLLREAGIACTPFEPYRLSGNEISARESIEMARGFLEAVADGVEWTSVFISSVLNSVPFLSDRQKIATICAALCRPFTRLYACASSTTETGWRQVRGKAFMNESNAANICFRLDYEPGIRIGDFQDRPKVQKYHTPAEFSELFIPHFRSVKVAEMSNNVTAICSGPLPVDLTRLGEAIDFEFDLPYPDGSRMGLAAEARAAFGKRLGVTL
jgi:hypothetical protein